LKNLWARLLAVLGRKDPKDFDYKWVRTHLMGEPDEANVLRHERQGWEPVPDNAIPKHLAPPDTPAERWAMNGLLNAHERNNYGGLRLYRIPKPTLTERQEFVLDHAASWKGGTDQTLSPYGGFTYFPDAGKGSLREQINAYYSEANRQQYPERQTEFEASEANLKVKGLSFN